MASQKTKLITSHKLLVAITHLLKIELWMLGGGCGYFARLLHLRTGLPIRVIDSDEQSISVVESLGINEVQGELGDALDPRIYGDERVVCFNLILHHLIGSDERTTRILQRKAIEVWREKADYIFVNEYVYDSIFGNLSGRLIFEITKSKSLSAIGKMVSKIFPSLRANTFGVGVRFRSHSEWIKLFEESGFNVVSKIYNKPERVSLPRRILLIRQVRRDSFVLAKANIGNNI